VVGLSTLYLSVIVLLPLAALSWRAHGWEGIASAQAVSSLKLTLGVSMVVALVNAVAGTMIAWTLVHDRFAGQGFVNALVDLPFALPTIVAGLTLLALYGPKSPAGVNVAFTRSAILLALLFVTLPFVVRTVQPVIESFPREVEEAALSLGASRTETFRRVIFPSLRPALAAGGILAFARALGEYGSVVFIAGNVPMRTEIAPLLVLVHLEEYDYVGAAIVATGLLAASIGLLMLFHRAERRLGDHRRTRS
jgi:sulfate transport system permease protein